MRAGFSSLLVVTSLALAACGGGSKGPKGPPPEYEEPQPVVPAGSGVASPTMPADAGPG